MNKIIRNIDNKIKEINYVIDLSTLIQIIITEYTDAGKQIKFTKKFVTLLEKIIENNKIGKIKPLSLADTSNKFYDVFQIFLQYSNITDVDDITELDFIYLKLLEIIIKYNIQFNIDNVYVENRKKLLDSKTELDLLALKLKTALSYMENLIISTIGNVQDIPENLNINTEYTIGTFIYFYLNN